MGTKQETTGSTPYAAAAQRLANVAGILALGGALAFVAYLLRVEVFRVGLVASAFSLPIAFTALMVATLPTERDDRRRFARNLRRVGKGTLILLFLWFSLSHGNALITGDHGFVFDYGEAQGGFLVVMWVSAGFTLLAALLLPWFLPSRWQDIPPDAKPSVKRALYVMAAATVVFLAYGWFLTSILTNV